MVFDNTGNSSIFAYMINGAADFYFSDGSSKLNTSSDFIKNIDGGFIIICPSIFGGVNVEERQPVVLGVFRKGFRNCWKCFRNLIKR